MISGLDKSPSRDVGHGLCDALKSVTHVALDTMWTLDYSMMCFVPLMVTWELLLLALRTSFTLYCVCERRMHCTTPLIVYKGDVLHVVDWPYYLELIKMLLTWR